MTSTYTPTLAAEILRRISEGEPLRQVCRDAGMPPESSVREWARDDRDGFAARYQQARMMQVECWSDEIVVIANRDDLDAQDKRVRIDTLKWLLSKIAPKNMATAYWSPATLKVQCRSCTSTSHWIDFRRSSSTRWRSFRRHC